MSSAPAGLNSPLNSVVDVGKAGVLNAANPDALSAVLEGKSEPPLQSDCDEQLLLSLPLKAPVKLHSIAIEGDSDAAPRTVKIFINKPHMGFDDAESGPPCTQMIEFTTPSSEPYLLKYVNFQFVQHLTIFVSDNQADSDVTSLSSIRLFGTPLEAMNMAEFKKVG